LDGTKDDHRGSLALAPYYTQTSRGYSFELTEIKKSFVVLYYQFVLMFERQDSRWLVTVLNHKKETNKIIITYWMPKVSDNFDIYSTIQIKPSYSLDQIEQYPEIPIEAIEMEFETHNRDDDCSDMADNFFARLLQPALEDN
jgi:hypothetical protein